MGTLIRFPTLGCEVSLPNVDVENKQLKNTSALLFEWSELRTTPLERDVVPGFLKKRGELLSAPSVYDILLFVNHECLGSCSYCYEMPARNPQKRLSVETLKRSLQRLCSKNCRLNTVWVLGGEPFLHCNLKNLLDVFDEDTVNIYISTGLMYRDERAVEEIMTKKNVRLITVLDYPFGRTRLDRNGVFLPYIDRGLALLERYRGRVQVGSVITPQTHDITGFRKWLISNVGYMPKVSLYLESSGKGLPPVMERVIAQCQEWIVESEKTGIPLYAPLRNLVDALKRGGMSVLFPVWGKCSMLYASIGIDADGTLLACPSGKFAGEEEGIFGFTSLDSIPQPLQERRQRLHIECTRCDYLLLCGGGCYKTFIPAYCDWQKFNATAGLYFYLKETRGKNHARNRL